LFTTKPRLVLGRGGGAVGGVLANFFNALDKATKGVGFLGEFEAAVLGPGVAADAKGGAPPKIVFCCKLPDGPGVFRAAASFEP